MVKKIRINENVDATSEWYKYNPVVTKIKADYNRLADDISNYIEKNKSEDTFYAVDYSSDGVIITFDYVHTTDYFKNEQIDISGSYKIYFELMYDEGWVIVIEGIDGYSPRPNLKYIECKTKQEFEMALKNIASMYHQFYKT